VASESNASGIHNEMKGHTALRLELARGDHRDGHRSNEIRTRQRYQL
jgi:hypothetical protein